MVRRVVVVILSAASAGCVAADAYSEENAAVAEPVPSSSCPYVMFSRRE